MSGRICRIVERVEQRYSAFFVSRLILMTGIKLRAYGEDSPDDPIALEKLTNSLRALLPAEEMKELDPLLHRRPSWPFKGGSNE